VDYPAEDIRQDLTRIVRRSCALIAVTTRLVAKAVNASSRVRSFSVRPRTGLPCQPAERHVREPSRQVYPPKRTFHCPRLARFSTSCALPRSHPSSHTAAALRSAF
jgi:hypothetical protein